MGKAVPRPSNVHDADTLQTLQCNMQASIEVIAYSLVINTQASLWCILFFYVGSTSWTATNL